jgi:hypothetical protein
MKFMKSFTDFPTRLDSNVKRLKQRGYTMNRKPVNEEDPALHALRILSNGAISLDERSIMSMRHACMAMDFLESLSDAELKFLVRRIFNPAKHYTEIKDFKFEVDLFFVLIGLQAALFTNSPETVGVDISIKSALLVGYAILHVPFTVGVKFENLLAERKMDDRIAGQDHQAAKSALYKFAEFSESLIHERSWLYKISRSVFEAPARVFTAIRDFYDPCITDKSADQVVKEQGDAIVNALDIVRNMCNLLLNKQPALETRARFL